MGNKPDFGYGQDLIVQEKVGGWERIYESLKKGTPYQVGKNGMNKLVMTHTMSTMNPDNK